MCDLQMEGRTKLCFLVLLVLLASAPAALATPATLADQKCSKTRFHSVICMDWHCRMECKDNYPNMIIYDAFCTVKHLVIRYCNCLVCVNPPN